MRAPRLPRRLRWKPRRPDWHAILTLQRPRRAQLRTRVLAGVLAVTVIALVAFDFAAVGALRRYLLGHTDAQLQTVLGLYRPMTITLPANANWIHQGQPAGADFQRKLPSGVRPPARCRRTCGRRRDGAAVGRWPPRVQQVIAGPRLKVPAPILAQFGVGFVSGQSPREFVSGNPGLVPRIPPGQLLRLSRRSPRRPDRDQRGR